MARKKAEPKAKPVELSSTQLLGQLLEQHGIKDAKPVTREIANGYQFGNLDRIDRLVAGLLDWMGDNVVEGGPCAASTTEALIALQHVSYKVFDSMREHETHLLLDELVKAKQNAQAHTNTPEQQAPTPAPKAQPHEDPAQLYR